MLFENFKLIKLVVLFSMVINMNQTSFAKTNRGVKVGSGNSKIGYGRFYSKRGDSIKLIKQQLLYSATIDLINKSFVELKLNKLLFWEKFNFKKNEYKNKRLEKLRERYKNNAILLSDKIRFATLRIDRNYGHLERYLIKYSLLKRSKSLGNKDLFLIKIKGVIDQNKITQLYNKYIYETNLSEKITIYLNLNILNIDFLWSELGTEKDVVISTLYKNISDYLSLNFENKKITIIRMSDIEYVKSKIEDGIYLALSYKIIKKDEDVDQGKTTLDLEMSTLVVNNKLNKMIGSNFKALDNYMFYFKNIESKKNSLSNLVTALYQFPLSTISKARNRYNETIPRVSLKAQFVFDHISDVFKLRDILNKSLIAKQLKVYFEKISLNNIDAKLNSIGTIENLVVSIKNIILKNNVFKKSEVTFEDDILKIHLLNSFKGE